MSTLNLQESLRAGRSEYESAAISSGLGQDPTPLHLVGDVYDAVLDATLWPSVLEKTASFVGGPAASLFSKDAASRSGVVAYDHGIDPYYKRLYFEKYLKLDPTNTGQFLARIGEPVTTADVIPHEEFIQTRFYREWAEPQGLVDFISSVLDRSSTSMAMFGVFRDKDDGVADERTRERMRFITPHIRRAVLIGRVIDVGAARAATLHEVFDSLTAGMFMVDAGGRLLHANVAGRALLAGAGFLRPAGGRLVPREPAADRTLPAGFAHG